MKNLKEILLEKLSIDSITPDIEFPIDGTCDKILEFLKEQGFKEVANSTSDSISKILNIKRNKCFINYNNTTIWFTDTSKKEVSEDNPIFLIEKSSKASSFSVYIPKKVIVNNDKKAFLEELNKCFNW